MAFGVSRALYSTKYRHEEHSRADRETIYEWYYKIYLAPWCILTPDPQVTTNLGGDKDYRDSVVGGFPLRIVF